MTWVYATALLVGLAGIIGLTVRLTLSGRQEPAGWRRAVAGSTAFGIAGMSASFGGWSPILAALGAVGAALAAAVYAGMVGAD